jgi:hypothetical protein
MAIQLKETWKLHAFPDDYPAKELVWAQEAEQRRNEDRRDIALELSGSGLKINRFTKKRDDGPNGKAARDRAFTDMLLAIGSPAYIEAYNNELSFTIDGEDFEITQGQLYERAKQRAEDLQEQIGAAKKRGASAEEITRLQRDLDAHHIIRDNANPQLGDATPDREQAIRDAIAGSADAQNTIRRESKVTGASAKSDEEDSMDRGDTRYAVKNELTRANIGTSFSASIDNSAPDPTKLFLAKEFTKATEDQPAVPETQPDPAEPNKTPGLTF